MPKLLSDSERDQTLRTVVEHCTPLLGSVRADDRWKLLRSRFLPRASGQEFLCIEPPLPAAPGETSQTPIELASGVEIGVTFRRGHHKCMFVSSVAGRQRIAINATTRLDALLIRRPSRVDQLQRRAFERTVVPADQPIPVHITSRDGGASPGDAALPTASAVATDLSAGGIGVRFLSAPPSWSPRVGSEARIEVLPPRGTPIRVDGFYRHCWTTPEGHISWGYQFVGLESSPAGRAALDALHQLVRVLNRESA